MPLRWRGLLGSSTSTSPWMILVVWGIWWGTVSAMSPAQIREMRRQTVDMFYHGFDNYMEVAFPEDELRPVSCVPLTRDSRNPRNVELNDVLGNYSLTLIDSLSTLAILASAPEDKERTGLRALRDFQEGVTQLVIQYGDGTSGPSGQGVRARGFDVDSKVQVFETVIRGVGGLLSAHLFAAGELPITGYKPRKVRPAGKRKLQKGEIPAIEWPSGFRYNGQLLRLALDLAQRLLPAFYTTTGMPYPRVNLRHGIPFYLNSPLHGGIDPNYVQMDGNPEITETCSAGAGSLVLEFTVLSRLTGDPRFEQLAKRSFWAVWDRRSTIGLIGAGVDAESGQWIGPYAGIGAGADSFFEYALKTHILLSGHEQPNLTIPFTEPHKSWLDPNTIYSPLSAHENSPEAFLAAWHEAHAAIKRHLYSGTHHPHYVNVHLGTGSPQAYWIDSLGAYYPGLLTLAGEVEEAIETNLLYTALWTRYSALPERWSVRDGHVEGGLGWWPGRPEFIESNYHLYRATQDPWYLHVGEMVLKDVTERCWTKCGWSGLQDVRTGEKSDRMESFFLGETAKYLYLLFDPDHPLNKLDAAYVFTTEGHPLLIPKEKNPLPTKRRYPKTKALQPVPTNTEFKNTCPAAPKPIPFTISNTAARPDIFHASSLIGLHNLPNLHLIEDNPATVYLTNYTYYPWTLPESMIVINGSCAPLPIKQTFTIEFPVNMPIQTPVAGSPNFLMVGPQNLVRLNEGILVKSVSGLKLGMVYESPSPFRAIDGPLVESWRVWNIANMALGRDEQIFISRDVIGEMTDPSFTRIRDATMLDIILQLEDPISSPDNETQRTSSSSAEGDRDSEEYYKASAELDKTADVNENDEEALRPSNLAAEYRTIFSSLLQHVTSALQSTLSPTSTHIPIPPPPPTYSLITIPAIAPTGLGAAPIIDVTEAPNPGLGPQIEKLTWERVYFGGDGCTRVRDEAVREYEVLVLKRGGCTFSEKLANIPSFSPSSRSLKLVIIISDDSSADDDDEDPSLNLGEDGEGERGGGGGEKKKRPARLIRPLLEKQQLTPSGLVRHHQICMVMVGGGLATERLFKSAKSVGLRRRYHIESQGLVVGNIVVV